VKKPDHCRNRGTGFLTDDGVPGVVELRCAGRCGPDQREPVGCGRDQSGGGEGEGVGRGTVVEEGTRDNGRDDQHAQAHKVV
jgi:hypothetical protein